MVGILHDQPRRGQHGCQGDLHLGGNARAYYDSAMALLPRGQFVHLLIAR
jgi:hypothetical protein